VLKTFAAVLALLMTCGLSMLIFDFHPTALFWAGVLTVAASFWLYARPDDYLTLLAPLQQQHREGLYTAAYCFGVITVSAVSAVSAVSLILS
jgi:hypothetical protein